MTTKTPQPLADNKKHTWDIYRQGWKTNGSESKAQYLGTYVGTRVTFKAACAVVLRFDDNYCPDRNTWWGCRLFDNQADAQKAFG